jgi:hypothetical protein
MSVTNFTGVGVPQQTQPKPTPVTELPDLILPVGSTSSPPFQNKISWTSDGTDTGALVADIATFSDATADASVWTIYDGDGASLTLNIDPSSGLAQILTNTGVFQKVISDSNGASSFFAFNIGTVQYSLAGQTIVSFPGGSPLSNPTTLTCPGASGTVVGVGTPQGLIAGFLIGVPFILPIGGGQADLYLANASGGNPAAGTGAPVSYLIWGT